MDGQAVIAVPQMLPAAWEERHPLFKQYATYILLPILKVFRFVGFTANGITYFRVLLSTPIVWLYSQTYQTSAFTLYLFALWCDHFDGEYARRTDTITDEGKIIDATGDKIFHIVVVATLLMVNGPLLIPQLSFLLLCECISCSIGWYKYVLGTGKTVSRKRNAKNTGANLWGKIKMGVQGVGISIALISTPQDSWYLIGFIILSLSTAFSMLSIWKHCEAITKKTSA